MPLRRRVRLAVTGFLLAAAVPHPGPARADALDSELGRNEVRVLAAPHVPEPGTTILGSGLPERLERLGYRRVRGLPAAPGEYFWGHDVFWIYRRAHRLGARDYPEELFALALERGAGGGRITGFLGPDRQPVEPGGAVRPWLEPEVLAESLTGDRARRVPVALEALPEHVWRAVLAAEDHRFFDHGGVDAVAVARAALANVLAGGVAQGGSTITQQLVRMRDLSPRRTMGRKVSEAVRALALEADHDKREILESYLNHVYLGHLEGVALHGFGSTARAWFGKDATELDLGEAAVVAAVIQAPNRLSPVRHPERAVARQRWVLSRMRELGWVSPAEVAREEGRGLPRLRVSTPAGPPALQFLSWVRVVAAQQAPRRLERGRGLVVQTAVDPVLQARAEEAVREGLEQLRRDHPALAGRPLSAALVALDGETGAVVAHVGGDPADRRDAFDRGRLARRQTGSALKPVVLLEAFDDCGRRDPLYPAARVLDEPVTVDLESGPWRPENLGRRFRGAVTVRDSLVASLNVPFVRIARWCGFDETAGTFRRAGLRVPADSAPSFVLGAPGATPAELAGAYTAFSTLGIAIRPLPVVSISRPGGRRIEHLAADAVRVADPAAAFLVRDLLADVVRRGTARGARIPGAEVWGKTGSSSGFRDAWMAGGAGSVVAVVWVGMDDGSPLGLSSMTAAVPLWRDFAVAAARLRPAPPPEGPEDVVTRWIQDRTGRLVDRDRAGAHQDLFDRDHLPPGRRLLLPDPPLPVVE